jgi:glycosyltransferase involved in cell wall biosynthesis
MTDTSPLAHPAVTSAKPRLSVDVSPLFEAQWTGIPVFTRRLIQALQQDGRLELSFCRNLTKIPPRHVKAALRAGNGLALAQEFEVGEHLRFPPADIAVPIFYPSVKKNFGVCAAEASTVHDMSTLVMPENHTPANVEHHMCDLRQELAGNEVTFCVSAATQTALHTYFPSAASRTRVILQYIDWPDGFDLMDRSLPRIALGRYAVVIGTIEPRKNLALLLRALATEALRGSDLKFVVIGKVGWLVEQFLADLAPEQRERLIFTGFVSDFAKYRLIRAASFMVYPSLYEGFGIPALEAMSLGLPVAAARTSSLPEVIGDAGLYFDPFSTGDLLGCLAELAHAGRRQELAAKARERAALFTPQRMAAPVVDWVMARG